MKYAGTVVTRTMLLENVWDYHFDPQTVTADHAADGETGYAMAAEGGYGVLVVDRMLPKRDGLSVIASLRAEGNTTPVLILSALGQVDDRVTGLRAGGDDYLPKPYAFSELLARVVFNHQDSHGLKLYRFIVPPTRPMTPLHGDGGPRKAARRRPEPERRGATYAVPVPIVPYMTIITRAEKALRQSACRVRSPPE